MELTDLPEGHPSRWFRKTRRSDGEGHEVRAFERKDGFGRDILKKEMEVAGRLCWVRLRSHTVVYLDT